MKALSLIAAGALAAGTLTAQTSLTTAVDFTVTDIHGVEHTLFEYLDAGKHVCLDFLFTTCGPCQANQPYFTEAYHLYGCNAGDVIFLSLETTVGDAETEAYELNYGGDNPPPIASCTDGGACEAAAPYGIGAFPTFILIAPDRTILEQDMWPLSDGAQTFVNYLTPYGIDQMACVVDVPEAAVERTEVVAYPNPAQSAVRLRLPAGLDPARVEVADLTGRLVFAESTAGTNLVLDVADWTDGVYAVTVHRGAQTKRTQLVVAH